MLTLTISIICVLFLWFIVNRTFSFLLDEKGNYKFIYIPDHTHKDVIEFNKVHITYCETLQEYQEEKDARFCSTTKDDGLFPVHLINPKYNKYGNLDVSKTKEYIKSEKLDICQNCFKDMSEANADFENNYGSYDNFQFKKFAKDFKNMYPTEFHSYKKKLKLYYYPKNWKKISSKYRTKANWTCEQCGTYYGDDKFNLNVHHINSIKSDCRPNNLKVLCNNCHEEEHEHLKQT